MTNEEVKKLTGLSLLFADKGLQLLLEKPEFKKFILNHSDVLVAMIVEAYHVSQSDVVTTPQTVQQVPKSAAMVDVHKTSAEEKSTVPVIIQKSKPLELIEDDVVQIISVKTGYPADMVEKEIDLEADLGIDTVKKMEIMADLAEKYNMHFRKNFNISHVSTVKSIALLISEDSQNANLSIQ